MTIEEILAGESKNVEFKENLPEKSIKYMKSVVAFANGTGGKIIFGIADKTREVVGFDKEDVCFANVRFFTGKRQIGTERNNEKSKIENYKVGGESWIQTK